jgi:signal transduction histidine kinase/ActR/RegA family two-component response regulator
MSTSLPRGSLRAYLLALTAGAVLPMVCFAVYLALALSRTQQDAIERGLAETARALATAVETQLRESITTLGALATSESLERADYGAFFRESHRVLESQKAHGWRRIHLASPDATPLMNTSGPGGAPLPLLETATVMHAAASRAAVVSDLFTGTEPGEPMFAIRVPVLRNGTVTHVLSAAVAARSMAAALSSHVHVPDRIAVLYDRRGIIVFRTINADRLIGTSVTERLARESAAQDFGVIEDVNREGTPVRTVFQRARPSGWGVAVGIPQRALYAEQRRFTRQVVTVGVTFFAISIAVALALAQRIRRSVVALVSTADTLSVSKGPLVPTDTPIGELARLGESLTSAGQLIRDRDASLERQMADLREAREAAEAGNRAKDEFLALLSHELRTPLNAVYGWARMLRSGQLRPDASEQALAAIERNAHAQVQLIDDLLDVSRVITGKMRLDVRPVDLRAVVEDALTAVRPAAESKGIRLQPMLDPRAGPITGDAARLQQIVWNLVMNAVKFTPKGGRVQVHLQRSNSHVEIVVSDTGSGIAPDVLPFIFERFRQADSSSTRAHGGLGLGLALVKHLVELHGGTVVAHSEGQDKGATFVVTLPLTIANVPDSASRIHPTGRGTDRVLPAVRLDGVRVLVVDDDAESLDLAMAILTAAGAAVQTSRASSEALAALKEWRPDVLVSDIEMPAEDGYALIRKVRALDPERGGATPAVALTAYGRMEDRVLSLTAGYNMHIPKPVDPGELTTIVASLAGHAAQQRVSAQEAPRHG